MEKNKAWYVYYDPDYNLGKDDSNGSWITSEVSRQIVDSSKGFEILNAAKLRNAMLSVVKREEERVVVIVFAQDVAPDTVLDDHTPTALVRQYLDNGGSIIWIGDIPFWYQAKRNGQNRDNNWWQNGAPANILGVNPTFPSQLPRAEITREGKMLGLRSAWTGIRPVLISKPKEIEVLAKAKCNTAVAYQPLSPPCWVKQLWNRLRGIRLGVGTTTVNLEIELDSPVQPKEENILRNRELANAWFKNFDSANPRSGFYRLWDYIPSTLTNKQLDDLHRVATYSLGNRE